MCVLLMFTWTCHAAMSFPDTCGVLFGWISGLLLSGIYLFATPFCFFLLLSLGLWLTFTVCPLSFYGSAALNILEHVQEFLLGANLGGMSPGLGACIFHFPRESGAAFQGSL